MILLYVIIVALGLAALYFIGIFLLVFAAFVFQSYQLATGKITKAQLDEMAAARKADKKKKKARRWSRYLPAVYYYSTAHFSSDT